MTINEQHIYRFYQSFPFCGKNLNLPVLGELKHSNPTLYKRNGGSAMLLEREKLNDIYILINNLNKVFPVCRSKTCRIKMRSKCNTFSGVFKTLGWGILATKVYYFCNKTPSEMFD